jgi:hypothetical protein
VRVKRAVLPAVLVGALVAPAAQAWRAPTLQEYRQVVKGLPASYHQSCIRYSVRVSRVDARYAAVFFRFVRGSGPCRPFDGQVLMKRLTPLRWVKIGEGSSWPCRVPGVSTRVVRDLFGGCAP